tara:strand:+ start:961 stop:1752 length:792 start_codon:yes stop_codon:yes gene_type:complete
MKTFSANLNVIIKACEKASKSLIRDFGEIEKLQVSIKGPSDYVSSADKKVEKTIINDLKKARPDYSILSEELGEIKNNKSQYRWIIDPIDGTLNFLHGIPHFAISVALEKSNEILCGVIFDPIKDEMFIAEKNEGAYLNRQKIRVSKRKKIKDSLVLTGGPSFNLKNRDEAFNEYLKISNSVTAPLRKLGSAALDMAYIAAGRADSYFQRNLSYWDIAAGIIIVKEAGGLIFDYDGKSDFVSKKNIIVSNPYINADVIELLSK